MRTKSNKDKKYSDEEIPTKGTKDRSKSELEPLNVNWNREKEGQEEAPLWVKHQKLGKGGFETVKERDGVKHKND